MLESRDQPSAVPDLATVESAFGQATLELQAPGFLFDQVESMPTPGVISNPPYLPYGMVAYHISGVTPGAITSVDLNMPEGSTFDGYYKQDPATGWLSRFDFDGQTGAVINGNVVTLYLQDGGRGDDDGIANGVIVDPGGPGAEANEAPESAYLIAIDDDRFVVQDTALTIAVMANDIGATQVTGASTPSKGLAVVSGNSVIYTPNTGETGNDSFTYTVTDGNGHYATATVRLNIGDLNSVPVITVSTPTPNITEPSKPGDTTPGSSFVFQRGGPGVAQALTVRYSITGTASRADIYPAESSSSDLYDGEVTFKANEPTVPIAFEAKYDALLEGTETLTVKLKPSSAYRVGTPDSATVNIADVGTGGVGDRVWVDKDANGRQDDDEVGLAGVKVTLLRLAQTGADEIVGVPTATSEFGFYHFYQLTPSTYYRVKFELDGPNQIGQYVLSPKYAAEADRNSDADPATGMTDYFTIQAGQVDNTFDAGFVPLAGRTLGAIIGPGVVPGQSSYTYSLEVAGNVASSSLTWSLQNLAGGSVPASFGPTTRSFDPGTSSTFFTVAVNFQNTQPAKIRLTASIAGASPAIKDIVLVQVIVSDPASEPAFTPSAAPEYQTEIANDSRGVARVMVKSALTVGEEWVARVRLIGPGANEGVNSIRVGFIQSATFTKWAGHYLRDGYSSDRWLTNEAQGLSFLDTVADNSERPWYTTHPLGYISGEAGPVDRNIGSGDTPRQGAPAVWPQLSLEELGPNYETRSDRISDLLLQLDFRLNVAAATSDDANGAANHYWGQAYNSWQFGGRGIVTDLGVTWSSSSDIRVTTGFNWTILGSRYEVPHSGPPANAVLFLPFIPNSAP
jgi:SdrD B-like domain/Bacterial Ig domain